MTRLLRLAAALLAVGTVSALAVLLHTTALTLGAFGALGVPCFAAAAALYAYEVVRDLRRHDVL